MGGSWRRRREESEQRETKRKPATQHNIIMAVLGDLSKNTAKSVWEMLARWEYREWKTSYCEGRKQSYKAPCISKDRCGSVVDSVNGTRHFRVCAAHGFKLTQDIFFLFWRLLRYVVLSSQRFVKHQTPYVCLSPVEVSFCFHCHNNNYKV